MFLEVSRTALMITGFVAVMLLLIEYINVLTEGRLEPWLRGGRWRQYLIGAGLGAVPGCLGAFTAVSLYAHRMLTLGGLTAAMIATSGDEAFVMLAIIPKSAVIITGLLFLIALAVGWLTDLIWKGRPAGSLDGCVGLEVHSADECECFPRGQVVRQLRELSPTRGSLSLLILLFVVAIIVGALGPDVWNWIRVTMLVVSAFALFVVATVPEHFLHHHLWTHVVKKHLPKVLLWTFGTLLAMAILSRFYSVEEFVQGNRFLIVVAACLIGLIPESGPHLIFVTLFAQGLIPLSVLLANSIVQDGHGMLPFLAHSRRGFVIVKLINLTAGFAFGWAGHLAGW